jgi:hypothetical protein
MLRINLISSHSSGVQHTVEKFLTRATTMLETLLQSEVYMRNYAPPNGNFGTPKISRTKNHLDVAPMERRKIYYKGEGGGFPQV